MIALAVTLSAALAGAVAAPSLAQPRSAIPWLSESIRPGAVPPPARPAAAARPAVPGTEDITVTPLGDVSRDAVGLLPPETTGFSRELWGPTPAPRVAELILTHPETGVPAAQALFRRLLLAEADPPPGSTDDAEVLLARIDRLLAIGALDEAGALLERAGPDTPELFRRWFDVGLLTNDAERPCAALRQNPALSPTLPARVFCLARGGDWNAAEITLTLGEDVGSIGPNQEELLARFLDPEIFEGTPEPPIPEPLTPLDFLMREAIALPRPSGPLPLAFLHHDLDPHAPMRVRAAAAERLVLSGGAQPPLLFAAYRAGEPAASGGLWDRAAAVQALDAALLDGDAEEIAAALAAADEALSARGLRVAFAREYSEALAELDPATVPGGAADRLFELLLLGGETKAARDVAMSLPAAETAVPMAAAGAPVSLPRPADALERAVIDGLGGRAGQADLRLGGLIDEGRQGEAILGALRLLAAGTEIDPTALRAALGTLRRAGQEEAARAIAVETLLLGREA